MRYGLAMPALLATAVTAQQPANPRQQPQQNPKNTPNREVFMPFFGMQITWQ